MSESTESVDREVEDFKAQQAIEYGSYVANGPIYHNGALAYVEGNPVPVSNVKQYHYLEQGLVREADAEAPAEPAADPLPQGDPIVIDPTNDDDDSAGAAEPTE